jgi:uncharacterized protein involved in exopolysaccharide biosynthesis
MWNAIYKKLWMVILLPLLAGGIAWFLTGRKANQYRSVAIIEASIPEQPAKSDVKTLKDIQEPDEYYKNLVETMKTELITSMASYRLLLHDLEQEIAFRPPAIQYSPEKKDLFKSRLEKKLSSFELLSEADPTEGTIFKVISNTDYNVARWLRDQQMTIERRPGSNEIAVSTLTEDPFLSAFASNALSQEYIRYQTAINEPIHADDSIGYYRDEVDRLRNDLEQKTKELKEASKAKTATNDAAFRRAKAARLAELEMRIVEEEWEVDNLRDQLARIERPEQPAQKVEPIDVASNAKILTIRNKIEQLSRLYAESGSNDKQLDSTINRLRKQLNDETVRIQRSSQRAAGNERNAATNRDREMLTSRIRRHEENIGSLRKDIQLLKNTTTPGGGVDRVAIGRLQREQQAINDEYNAALANLRKAEVKSGPAVAASRERHHLILKEKALPSAEPESPWAMAIVISAFMGTLTVVLIYIALTRPAPAPMDDIFLRVNYANQRRTNKKKHPRKEDVSISNN